MIKSLNVSNSRADAEARIGEPIPDDKYEAYVRIFEGMKTLDEIRKDLDLEDIVEVKTVEDKPPKFTPFPEVKKEFVKFKPLYDSLTIIFGSNLGLSDTDTVAGQEMLKGRRAVLKRLMWIIATYGTLEGDVLTTDSIIINTHKKGTSGFPTSDSGWNRWIAAFSKIGIHGELVLAVQDRDQLISPIGWLRDRIPKSNDPAWFLNVSFDEKLGGAQSLKLLQSYAQQLDQKYGKRTFSRFTKADMRLFVESE